MYWNELCLWNSPVNVIWFPYERLVTSCFKITQCLIVTDCWRTELRNSSAGFMNRDSLNWKTAAFDNRFWETPFLCNNYWKKCVAVDIPACWGMVLSLCDFFQCRLVRLVRFRSSKQARVCLKEKAVEITDRFCLSRLSKRSPTEAVRRRPVWIK